jgi:plasmid stabilization system protein ParE
MATGSGNNPHCLVEYSPEADLDLADIHTHTAKVWSSEQADRYLEFLLHEAQKIADGDGKGKPVPRRAGRFYVTATWHNARDGHRVVYEVTAEGIFVVRILHTAMLLLKHVKRR